MPDDDGRRPGRVPMDDAVRPRPFALSAALVCGVAAAGLALRLVPAGLPAPVVKHGGSVLWAMMVYGIVSTLLPWQPPRRCALLAAAVAVAVETSQLYHAPALDAFRQTRPGALLLGRVFSLWDIVAYCAAMVPAAAIDRRLRKKPCREGADAGRRTIVG
jgi:hypothetical protein